LKAFPEKIQTNNKILEDLNEVKKKLTEFMGKSDNETSSLKAEISDQFKKVASDLEDVKKFELGLEQKIRKGESVHLKTEMGIVKLNKECVGFRQSLSEFAGMLEGIERRNDLKCGDMERRLKEEIQGVMDRRIGGLEENERERGVLVGELQLNVNKQYQILSNHTSFSWFLRDNSIYLVILVAMMVLHYSGR
jgi:hypothetical protein